MPHLRIETNVAKGQVPADLAKTLCQVISTSLVKPLNYCCVTIVPDCVQSWGGGDEPSGQATVMSIGQLGVKENVKHSKAIFDAVKKGLGIAPDKLYIHFVDAKSQDVGYNGTTFYEIFGG